MPCIHIVSHPLRATADRVACVVELRKPQKRTASCGKLSALLEGNSAMRLATLVLVYMRNCVSPMGDSLVLVHDLLDRIKGLICERLSEGFPKCFDLAFTEFSDVLQECSTNHLFCLELIELFTDEEGSYKHLRKKLVRVVSIN